jgi:hypothetical protein
VLGVDLSSDERIIFILRVRLFEAENKPTVDALRRVRSTMSFS